MRATETNKRADLLSIVFSTITLSSTTAVSSTVRGRRMMKERCCLEVMVGGRNRDRFIISTTIL